MLGWTTCFGSKIYGFVQVFVAAHPYGKIRYSFRLSKKVGLSNFIAMR